MRKGILEYCVLQILARERCYPSDILARLKEAKLIVVEGTLYTLLNRLRKEGKLAYMWEESPKGPPRKYFHLTASGIDAVQSLGLEWEEMVRTVEFFRNLKPQTPQIEQ